MKPTSKFARSFVESEIITISPAEARIMLDTMPVESNRRLRPGHVELLAGLITTDHWHVTHQGIAFNQHGTLIDGQHRLQAITIANRPVQMMVTYGLPGEVMDAVDRGATRSIADVLHLVHGVEGGNIVSGLCRVIQRELHGQRNIGQTVAGTLGIYRTYAPGIDWAVRKMGGRTTMNKSAYRAALALGYMVEPEPGLVDGFFEAYRSGEHQQVGEPAWRLREFTSKSILTRARLEDGELFKIACNALLAHFNRELVHGINRNAAGVEGIRAALKKAQKGGSHE